ncbi:DnaJ domain-containing protein, partial [Pelagophyceae sp. CCMP2097]
DYYAILRVDETAPYSAIRSAFKKRIVTCHPDVDKSPEAAAEFRRVVDAHECLKDEKARSAYD